MSVCASVLYIPYYCSCIRCSAGLVRSSLSFYSEIPEAEVVLLKDGGALFHGLRKGFQKLSDNARDSLLFIVEGIHAADLWTLETKRALVNVRTQLVCLYSEWLDRWDGGKRPKWLMWCVGDYEGDSQYSVIGPTCVWRALSLKCFEKVWDLCWQLCVCCRCLRRGGGCWS